MTLPTSGPLSINDIAGEFGGTAPHSMNEYYAGGGLVPAGASGTYGAVPSSGQISIQNFYGTAAQYQVSRSLRFNSADTSNLQWTPSASPTDRTKTTLSFWVKRSAISSGTYQNIYSVAVSSGYYSNSGFETTDQFTFGINTSNYLYTTQLFRDPSAWYHFVCVVDTTQATASDRLKVYVNGSRITSFSSSNYPSLNSTDNYLLYTYNQIIGGVKTSGPGGSVLQVFNGYMAEFYGIDGQALTPSSFGQTNATTGVWEPIGYSGSYGTNGFYLPFNQNSTSTYAASFNGSSQSLTVPASSLFAPGTGNFTLEAWVYPTSSANGQIIWSQTVSGTNYFMLTVEAGSNRAGFIGTSSGGGTYIYSGANLSLNAWNHVAVVRSSGTVTVYCNGIGGTPTANTTDFSNTSYVPTIGRYTHTGSQYFAGYMSNIRYVKGTAVYTSNFTPPTSALTAISGTSFLSLQNSSIVDNSGNSVSITNNGSVSTSVQYALNIPVGEDESSNSNNWLVNNFGFIVGAGNDSLVDTPTNYGTDTGAGGEVRGNYATLNPLNANKAPTNGNLDLAGTASGGYHNAPSTIAMTTGKWYWEVTCTAYSGDGTLIGVSTDAYNYLAAASGSNYIGSTSTSWSYYGNNGYKYNNLSGSSYGSTFTTNDVIGIALDLDNGAIYFSKNGTWQNSGVPTSGASKTGAAYTTGLTGSTYYAGVSVGNNNSIVTNFGQRPFAYTAPSGFKALCTQNLPDPTIADGGNYFNTVLYTGNGSTQSITGVGFQPDWVWFKRRSASASHVLVDVLRGNTKNLFSNLTDAEQTQTEYLTSFNADGFSLGDNNPIGTGDNNVSGATYVAWNWKANGAGVSNTAGTITSTVSANTTAGFSIVTYTGTGANATVGHGIGTAPTFIIVKRRNSATAWPCLVKAANGGNGQNGRLNLNETASYGDNIEFWNNTSPTSTVFSVGIHSTTNASGGTYVAYCFAPVAGYSAFGSYTGNASTDGPFVYTGFRPRFVLVKKSSAAGNWLIFDTSRSPFNVQDDALFPNLSDAETVSVNYNNDFISNGFKVRTADGSWNDSGVSYIYAAFAENPFKISRAR